MEQLSFELRNCHGVRELDKTFSFEKGKAVAIYAPNGTMKSSFARTLSDFSLERDSKDHVFPDRPTTRQILDEQGNSPDPSSVAVFLAYDEKYASNEFASTLLVNAKLRSEYEEIHKRLAGLQQNLVKALKATSRTKADIPSLVSELVTRQPENFFGALVRLSYEVEQLDEPVFSEVSHDLIFNPSVDKVIRNPEFQAVLSQYVTRLNQLLDDSTFFSRETFTYYNAETVSKSLGSQGFFDANHSLLLSGDTTPKQVSSKKELEALIVEEKQRITEDPELKKKLDAFEKAITGNQAVRDFFRFISDRPELLSRFSNVDLFQQELWTSYLKANEELFLEAVSEYKNSEERRKDIEAKAVEERTLWEDVIELFNSRFHVPFTLAPRNREKVILAQETFLELDFVFNQGDDSSRVEREHLLRVLSTGEKKAFYILNILFEVEARKQSGETTLFVVDDIADSFDYKNKYAIIQYLKDMSEEPEFRLILLTHNFDFLRTIFGRQIVSHGDCFMAEKTAERVVLSSMDGSTIQNPFTQDFKKSLYVDGMKRIASIPFARNLLEYTKGTSDPDYLKLTSLIHWKPETGTITNGELDQIFADLFVNPENKKWVDESKTVFELMLEEADGAIDSTEGVNFANKIVLAIAIRLLAESYMIDALADQQLMERIKKNQTPQLYKEFKARSLGGSEVYKVLENVLLMTPENIHINSFMYEPIIDMSDASLRDLYQKVKALGLRAGD